MKGYSYASAWQDKQGLIGLSHGHCTANSEDEARGIALRIGTKAFPNMAMVMLQVLEFEHN